MRIYQVITTGHLISAMLLQEEYKEESLLVCPVWIKMKFPNYKQLESFFGRVVILNTGFRHSHSREETKKYYFDSIPELSNEDNEIYIWGAQSGLGILCAEESIPFTFCEEGTGFLSRPEVLSHHDARNPDLIGEYELLSHLGLYDGTCDSAENLLGNVKAQLVGYKPPNEKKIIDFSISEKLNNLNETERNRIIRFFIPDEKRYEIKENSTVLFTQHFANLFAMSLEEQAHLYQIFVDYFCNDSNVVIKPHPDDLLYYSELFPDAITIHDRFPSEFIPYVCSPSPQKYATVYSSAIYNMMGQGEVIELSIDYEKNYLFSNKYYVAACIVCGLNAPVYTFGIDKCLFNEIIDKNLRPRGESIDIFDLKDAYDNNNRKVLVLDDCSDENQYIYLSENIELLMSFSTIIFVNSNKKYLWCSDYLDIGWDNIAAIPITKSKLNGISDEDFFEDMEKEIIYIWTRCEEERDTIMNEQIKKELPHVGIELKKVPIDDNEERILMLEGMLAATERSLLFYKNKVREFQKNNL